MFITIPLEPSSKSYELYKNKLISLIFDLKNIYEIDVEILLKSLNSKFTTNYIIGYDVHDDIITPKSIIYFIINDKKCLIQYVYGQNEIEIQKIIENLDRICYKNKYKIVLRKNIKNESTIIKSFYEILKNKFTIDI